MSVWAILVAAGRGERLGLEHPKAFAKLGEDPLLAEPLRRLEDSDWIDAVVLVAPPEWEEPAILLAEELGCGKVSACVTGGATRAESVRLALAEVGDDAVEVGVVGFSEIFREVAAGVPLDPQRAENLAAQCAELLKSIADTRNVIRLAARTKGVQ